MNIFFEITTLNYTICHKVKAMKEKRIKSLGRGMHFSLKFSSILAIFHQSDKKLFVRALEMRNLIFNHKKISLCLYLTPCYTNTISTGNVIQEEVRGEAGRPGGAGDLNYKGLFFMKHDFYLLLTLGSSSAEDETPSRRCSVTCARAGVLLSSG